MCSSLWVGWVEAAVGSGLTADLGSFYLFLETDINVETVSRPTALIQLRGTTWLEHAADVTLNRRTTGQTAPTPTPGSTNPHTRVWKTAKWKFQMYKCARLFPGEDWCGATGRGGGGGGLAGWGQVTRRNVTSSSAFHGSSPFHTGKESCSPRGGTCSRRWFLHWQRWPAWSRSQSSSGTRWWWPWRNNLAANTNQQETDEPKLQRGFKSHIVLNVWARRGPVRSPTVQQWLMNRARLPHLVASMMVSWSTRNK